MPPKTKKHLTKQKGGECNSCKPEDGVHHAGKHYLETIQNLDATKLRELLRTSAFYPCKLADYITTECNKNYNTPDKECENRVVKSSTDTSFPTCILGGKKKTPSNKKKTTKYK